MEEGRALLAEINRARTNPQQCIEDIKTQLSKFESAIVMRTAKGERLRVTEGKTAWQDAILYLERAKRKEPLLWSDRLAQVAITYEHHHQKGEEVNPFNILKAEYKYQGSISFNINESQVQQNLRELVISMIIGDGDEERGNRTTIFNPTYICYGGLVVKRNKKTIAPMFFSDTDDFTLKAEDTKESVSLAKTDFTSVSSEKMIEKGKEMFTEINSIRREPKKLIPTLQADLFKFQDDKTIVKQNLSIKTKEGKASYDDLISQLEQAYPIPLLKYSEGLAIAAAEQVAELEKKQEGDSLATNSNGYLKKYTIVSEGMNNIAMNRSQEESIIDMLILLLVGDGDKKRSARRKLMGPILKVAGIAIGNSYFVINIGENCRDNKTEVENYLAQPSKTEQKSEPGFDNTATFSPSKKPILEAPISKAFTPISSGPEKLVTKKTTKTSSCIRNGKNYKTTFTKITFEDGTTEEIEDEELVG